MFVALLRQRRALYRVAGTLFCTTQAAVAAAWQQCLSCALPPRIGSADLCRGKLPATSSRSEMAMLRPLTFCGMIRFPGAFP